VPNYQKIFDRRGKLYHQAMESCPGYRAEEFRAVLQEAGIAPGMTVVDVPSGGAYLADYLPDVTLLGLESSLAFAELARERTKTVLLYEDDTFPLAGGSVDRVLSIAGLHHIPEKRRIFAEMHRVLGPGGRVVLADVAADSPVRRFLDEFVGAYTDTGHSGCYFGDTTRRELQAAGFGIVKDSLLQYRWHGPDREQLAGFCQTLFGMVRADLDTVKQGIADYLGFHDHAGMCGLNWELQCFVCEPREAT
jgi:SAM-dependent methyltransferase